VRKLILFVLGAVIAAATAAYLVRRRICRGAERLPSSPASFTAAEGGTPAPPPTPDSSDVAPDPGVREVESEVTDETGFYRVTDHEREERHEAARRLQEDPADEGPAADTEATA
jgi:hypothetical protein